MSQTDDLCGQLVGFSWACFLGDLAHFPIGKIHHDWGINSESVFLRGTSNQQIQVLKSFEPLDSSAQAQLNQQLGQQLFPGLS